MSSGVTSVENNKTYDSTTNGSYCYLHYLVTEGVTDNDYSKQDNAIPYYLK